VYVRELSEGQASTFGVSGRLWRDALVMYDRETGSLWSQIDGRAIHGKLRGRRLEKVESFVTSWDEWKSWHPYTLVLRTAGPPRETSRYANYEMRPDVGIFGHGNPDDRLHGKTIVLGLSSGQSFSAVSLGLVEEHWPIHGEIGGVPVVVLALGGGEGRAYRREVDGRVLAFQLDGEQRLSDRETGTTWDARTGRGQGGPLSGATLQSVPALKVYWQIWANFHPDSALLVEHGSRE